MGVAGLTAFLLHTYACTASNPRAEGKHIYKQEKLILQARWVRVYLTCLPHPHLNPVFLAELQLGERVFLRRSCKNLENRRVYGGTTSRPLTIAVFMVTTTRKVLCWEGSKVKPALGAFWNVNGSCIHLGFQSTGVCRGRGGCLEQSRHQIIFLLCCVFNVLLCAGGNISLLVNNYIWLKAVRFIYLGRGKKYVLPPRKEINVSLW